MRRVFFTEYNNRFGVSSVVAKDGVSTTFSLQFLERQALHKGHVCANKYWDEDLPGETQYVWLWTSMEKKVIPEMENHCYQVFTVDANSCF